MYNDRILILDDEELTGQTIKSIAEFSGLQARHTTQPREFFELVASWQPGHIALDLVMPQMDGVEVMVELARLNCQARIILTSGVGNRILDAAARSASEHGLRIAGILAKPFSPPRLRELLSDTPDTDPEYLVENGEPLAGRNQELNAEALQLGIERNEFFLVYQPKVDCNTSLISGFEALMRWQHPSRGVVRPERFIPLAERHGLIDRLTEHAMDEGLRWLTALPEQINRHSDDPHFRKRAADLTLAINISAASLDNQPLFERLGRICERHGVNPSRIIFELTETSAMEDPVASLDILTRLRMKGFQLSIDDFGTGYSSMLQLARLPFSEIKVDKSFVMTATESPESRTVIKSIIELGHGLGLSTTAEGIENAETMEYLRDVGCDLAQGYHIARPMPSEQVAEWLLDRSRNDEESRISVLRALNLLDTPNDPRFDRVTRLAQRLFDVPITLFSLIDVERQWFKSAQGLEVKETPRSASFCSEALNHEGPMVIRDASKDAQYSDNPLVTGFPHIRFYAGSVVRARSSARLGTLCLIDNQPRDISDKELTLLEGLRDQLEYEVLADPAAANDPQTGLLNRHGFEVRAQQLLQLCHAHGLEATLLFLDLDEFRAFNQRVGPAAGDAFLEKFSRLFRTTLRKADLLSRFGNDEFTALFIARDQATIRHAIEALATTMQQTGEHLEYGLDYSLGSSELDHGHPDNLQQMLARADQAMFHKRRNVSNL